MIINGIQSIDLCHRAIGILRALDGQQRASDFGAISLDIKLPEFIAEPHAVPAIKRAVHVGIYRAHSMVGAQLRRAATARGSIRRIVSVVRSMLLLRAARRTT